jgi:hypothetical protein
LNYQIQRDCIKIKIQNKATQKILSDSISL